MFHTTENRTMAFLGKVTPERIGRVLKLVDFILFMDSSFEFQVPPILVKYRNSQKVYKRRYQQRISNCAFNYSFMSFSLTTV